MPVKSKRKIKKAQGTVPRAAAVQAEPAAVVQTNFWTRHSRSILLCLYLCVALYLVPVFPHGGSANELTRWATAASLVEKHTFELSWILPLVGPIVDTAKVGEHTYSNKAPGPLLIAVPAYAAVRIFTGPPDASNMRISWTIDAMASFHGSTFSARTVLGEKRRISPVAGYAALRNTTFHLQCSAVFSCLCGGGVVFRLSPSLSCQRSSCAEGLPACGRAGRHRDSVRISRRDPCCCFRVRLAGGEELSVEIEAQRNWIFRNRRTSFCSDAPYI